MNNKDILTQRGLFSDERRFEIKEGRYLYVDINKLKKNTAYQLDLVALKPKSKFRVYIAWPWLLAALIVLLTAYSLLELLPQFFDLSLEQYAFPIKLGSGSLVFIFVIVFLTTTCRERVFIAPNTGYPLVRLLVGKPNRKTYQAFVAYLESRIKALSKHLQLNKQQRIAGELRMMRRLMKQHILSEKEYERFKSKLMKMSN